MTHVNEFYLMTPAILQALFDGRCLTDASDEVTVEAEINLGCKGKLKRFGI